MRFKNEADYQRVVEIIEGLEFPIHNAVNKDGPVAPTMPLRPASATPIQNSVGSIVRYQPSNSDAVKNLVTQSSSTVNDACYTLARPFLMEESPFFRQSETASSYTARPGSAWSLDSSRASDTASSISFGDPLVMPSSVFNDVRPTSASQFERTVCIYSPNSSFSNHYPFPALLIVVVALGNYAQVATARKLKFYQKLGLIRYIDRFARLCCIIQI
jgi:hypothetical protein